MGRTLHSIVRIAAGFLLLAGAVPLRAQERAYDPLAVASSAKVKMLDLTVRDDTRKRDIPIRVYYAVKDSPSPVVLFSHGLGGSREGYAYLGNHWAARGYVVVALQHPGSDDAVWRGKPPGQVMRAMVAAANVQNLLLRVKDVSVVLDQLERWNKTSGNALFGRLDLKHVGMSGHSFGAVTTQAVSGQRMPQGTSPFTDARVTAAIAMSPSSPKRGTAAEAFGAVKIPWMLMTGTKDASPIGNEDVASRLAVFPALPFGNKYELVLDKAEHSVFSDRALPGDTEARNPNHQRSILAISTAFWDAYLGDSPAAKAWLSGDGPRGVLEGGDRWQKK